MENRKTFPPTNDLLNIAQDFTQIADDENVKAAILGGVAMHLYGSDRLTHDVDFVADGCLHSKEVLRPLTFGGEVYASHLGIDVDWIVRSDEQAELYEEALENSEWVLDQRFRIVRPEYLAIIKLAARRSKDYDDLMTLLMKEGLVDAPTAFKITERILGTYAREDFEAAVAEAEWRRSQK